MARRLTVESLEERRLMAADTLAAEQRPLGATVSDTGEFFLGTVAVTPVFLESDGSIDTESQNWTPGEFDEVMGRIEDGLDWWRETLDGLGSIHSVEFVIDTTYAVDPVEIGYEPIDRSSSFYNSYVNDFLVAIDARPPGPLNDAMFAFNDSQRLLHGADWSWTIFVIDASDDADGLFPAGSPFRGAFALPGGLYMMLPSERPVRTVAHETGHLFWAMDEYAGAGSQSDFRGYYNTQNLNAVDGAPPGFAQADSIMASDLPMLNAFLDHTSAPVTLAQVGWQDSDGDGIFDVLDVPLSLSGSGWYDVAQSEFRFVGEASAVPMFNQNSVGNQSDITLNRIRRVEIAVDDGPWQLVESPNRSVTALDLTFPVPETFSEISLRVVDDVTGVASDAWTITPTRPSTTPAPLRGYAFLDQNQDGQRAVDESLLQSVSIEVRAENGDLLPSGRFDVSETDLLIDLPTVDGMTFSGDRDTLSARAQVQTDPLHGPLLHLYDLQLGVWTPRLSNRGAVEVALDAPVGAAEVDVVGLNEVSYARLEAFDADGRLITRQTTDLSNDADGQLGVGDRQTLRVFDQQNRIHSLRILGHASTQIGVQAVRHGVATTSSTDVGGTFAWQGLADGTYQLSAMPERVIHAFDPIVATIAGGELVGQSTDSGLLVLPARVVDSPWHNTAIAEDVSGDGTVSAVDALQVINDINANDTRWLTFQESLTSWVDVNNDGRVSALDALVVINRLNAEQFAGAGEGEPHPLNKDSAAATDNPAPIAPPPVAMPEAIVNAERSQTISVNAGSVNAAEVDVHSPQPAKSLVGAEGEDVWIVSPGTPHFDPVIRRAADLAILDWLDDEESNHPADGLTHLVEQSLVDDGRSHKS